LFTRAVIAALAALPLLGASQSAPNVTCLRLAPPAYGAQVWTGSTAAGQRPADIIANWGSTTVNPHTAGGPGTARNAADAATINAARKAGLHVLGYIWTGYGSVPAAQVELQVRQWKSWYGVTDVFLDGAPGSAPIPAGYAKVYRYVHARTKGAQVWANPGAVSVPQIMKVADVVQIFEGSYQTGSDQLVGLKIPAWVRKFPASRFEFTVYLTPRAQLPTALALIRADHGEHAFVTNENGLAGHNPYNTLPTYWRREVRLVRAGCRTAVTSTAWH
jgi:hypothetical protein